MSAHAQTNAEILPWERAEHHPRFRHASATPYPCPPWPARSEEAKKGRIRRRLTAGLAVTVAVGMLLWGCAVKPRVYRVGILAGLEPLYDIVDGFKTTMTELGYIEGKNVAYELRTTNSESEAEKQILKGFVADKKDLILAFPAQQALLAKEATAGTNISVVFCHANIEGTDLVQSITKPGGNVTGVRFPGPDIAVKRLEILHELVPHARRIWVPYSSGSPMVPAQLDVLRIAADREGIALIEAPFRDAGELLADIRARDRSADIGMDAILLIIEPLVKTPAAYPGLAEFVARHDVPIGGVIAPLSGTYTLFGVATDNAATGKLAAQQADKIFRGTPAGNVRVTTADVFFRLNYRLAREQGLTVPVSLLKQADEVMR